MVSETGATDATRLATRAARRIAELSGVVRHDVCLVLGSGWASASRSLGDTLWEAQAVDVPGFHGTEVPGHTGLVSSVRLANGKHALVLGARTHLYAGWGVHSVAHGVRTARATGASVVILTNGSGATSMSRTIGEIVLIADHLNFTGVSPLEGSLFVDMTDAYSPRLRELCHRVDGNLSEGIYAQFRGPQYETPAEVAMARLVGADLVGMSTALETIAAREAGMEVLALALVTNHAAGVSEESFTHESVIDVSPSVHNRMENLLASIVREL